jgi:hypothetical protein
MRISELMWYLKVASALVIGILLANADWLGNGGFHLLVLIGAEIALWQALSWVEMRLTKFVEAAERADRHPSRGPK